MRRHTYDRNGDVVTPEDVLEDAELAEYRREHPQVPVHQLRFWPDPADEVES